MFLLSRSPIFVCILPIYLPTNPLPGVLLATPTFWFCLEVVTVTPHSVLAMSALSTLLDGLGPDLINYSLGLLAMALNLLYLQRSVCDVM
jgi:hypothetical protein